MIQKYLKDQLKELLPKLRWTMDYKRDDDELIGTNTGTVYYEGGGSQGAYESGVRSPRYMVYISSKDWAYAQYAAEKVYDTFHGVMNLPVEIEHQDGYFPDIKYYHVYSILAAGEPNPLGVDNEKMEYSINFDVKLAQYTRR